MTGQSQPRVAVVGMSESGKGWASLVAGAGWPLTIYDPDGHEYEMEWCDDLVAEGATWCDFCDSTVDAGWIERFGSALDAFVLCDDCAKANATTDG